MDWKPSWKDKYLVDFNRSSRKMICMVCHLRMVCVRSNTVSKHFKRVHKWKNHFSEINGDVGMSLHEKEGEQEDA